MSTGTKGNTPSLSSRLAYWRMMKPEPRVQPIFISLISYLLLAAIILGLGRWLLQQPRRHPAADEVVVGKAVEVAVGGNLKAWRLSAPGPRFGGLSALAKADGEFIAVTDSGVVVRFAAPRQAEQRLAFRLHDLPDGPGSPHHKSARDSESILADPHGRGWWVGFENRHSLYLYDWKFEQTLASRRLDVDWPVNGGAEAIAAAPDGTVMALPERGGPAVGGAFVAPAWTVGATNLPDGRLALVIRRPTGAGFDNEVRIVAGAGKPQRRIPLGLAVLDNVEGITAEALPDGGIRLWMVTDDNFRLWMRTLLLRLDLPRGA